MKKYKFSRTKNAEFAAVLRSRVNLYFKETDLNQGANNLMVFKTINMLAIYLLPYFIVVTTQPQNLWVLFGMYVVMGLGKAFIGTSVMHDALHGAYDKRPWVNRLIGFSAVIIGADPNMWKIQHNQLHHTYTNIENADEDIASRYVLRFTPHQPRRWFHAYQHIYATPLYGLTTLIWVTVKDFIKLHKYNRLGILKNAVSSYLTKIILGKILYYTMMVAVPIMVLEVSWWMVLILFATMHFVTGVILTIIFQLAHVMSTSEFFEEKEEDIEENWLVHQLQTTCNFAMKNRLISWFVGGLNFQVEHHLFPNICHVHYPKLSAIVKKTAREFDIPYHYHETLGSALKDHFRLLKMLGSTSMIKAGQPA